MRSFATNTLWVLFLFLVFMFMWDTVLTLLGDTPQQIGCITDSECEELRQIKTLDTDYQYE